MTDPVIVVPVVICADPDLWGRVHHHGRNLNSQNLPIQADINIIIVRERDQVDIEAVKCGCFGAQEIGVSNHLCSQLGSLHRRNDARCLRGLRCGRLCGGFEGDGRNAGGRQAVAIGRYHSIKHSEGKRGQYG